MMTGNKHPMHPFDLLGEWLKTSGHFKGKGRLTKLWLKRTRESGDVRLRILPGGGKVTCDLSISYEAMVWLEKEEQEDLEVLNRLLRPGQTFADCGANIGIWSIVAASAVGSHGKVFAFEPNPSTVVKLWHNISHGKYEQITVVPMAVGDANAEVSFKCEAAHNVSHIVGDRDNNTITVPVVALDTFLSEKINGCKIDVEGFEMNALKGASNLLKKGSPWLCIEFNTILAGVNRLMDWDVHNYLRDLGYTPRRFQDALDFSPVTLLADEWQTESYCNLFYSVGKE